MLLSSLVLTLAAPAAQLPFSKYTDPDWPNGLNLGHAVGASFGDYDGGELQVWPEARGLRASGPERRSLAITWSALERHGLGSGGGLAVPGEAAYR